MYGVNVGMCQVGLGSSTTAEFLAKARNIVTQHRELQNQVEELRSQIGHLEMTQLRAVSHCKTDLAWVAGCLARWFVQPQMVTHRSTNRTCCRVTSLIRSVPLLLMLMSS